MLPCRYFCRYFRYLLKYFFLKCGDKLEQAEVTLKEIYEKVSLKVPLEQRRFFNSLTIPLQNLKHYIPTYYSKRVCILHQYMIYRTKTLYYRFILRQSWTISYTFAVTTNKVYSNKNLHENQEMPMCIIGKITQITDVYDE